MKYPSDEEIRRMEEEAEEYEEDVEASLESAEARYYRWKQKMVRLDKADKTIIQLNQFFEKEEKRPRTRKRNQQPTIDSLLTQYKWQLLAAFVLLLAMYLWGLSKDSGEKHDTGRTSYVPHQSS